MGADVAMAVVLLIAAGLMIKRVGRLLGVNPGFDPDHVLTLQVSMTGPAYAKNEAVIAKTDAIVARLRSLPGVEAAAAAGQIPLGVTATRGAFTSKDARSGPTIPASSATRSRRSISPSCAFRFSAAGCSPMPIAGGAGT